jgi:hypothetical protein
MAREKDVVHIGNKRFRIVAIGKMSDLSPKKGGRGGAQPMYRLTVKDKNGKTHHFEWLAPLSNIAVLRQIP